MSKKDRRLEKAASGSSTPVIVESGAGPRGRTEDEVTPAGMERWLDRLLSVQRPVVLANIALLRRRMPNASPQRLIVSLERQYLASVSVGGAAIGATAVVPGIGTGASIALSGAGAAGFLEASALFAQSVTEVHGIRLEDPDRARALVMMLMMGSAGTDLVGQVAAQVTGRGPALSQYWGSVITQGLPKILVGELTERARSHFVRHMLAQQGAGLVGRALPFGVGAAIGGVGNAVLGRRVISSARDAFGPAPTAYPDVLVLPVSRAERRAALTTGQSADDYEPVRLHVRDFGGDGGPVALLVHDLGGDSRVWYAVAAALVARGYHVLAPDLSGHGGSPRARVYSISRWTADVRASVPAGARVIVGHGIGAVIANHVADGTAEQRLVLVEPVFGPAKAPARSSAVTSSSVATAHPAWSAEEIALDVTNAERLDPAVRKAVEDKAALALPDTLVEPMLVVRGSASKAVTDSVARGLSTLGAELRTVPGAGHEVFRDETSTFLRLTEDWIPSIR